MTWTDEQTAAAARAAARDNLYLSLIRLFPVLSPGASLERAPYLEAMCHALQEVAEGRSTRLIISAPPRHLKSFCASVLFPAYLLGHDPGKSVMVVSYGGELAREFGDAFRRLVQSADYRELFPETRFEVLRQDQMKTTAGGGRMATSLNGATTGFGCDVLILDDLIKASDIQSAAQRESVRRVFDEAIYSRINSKQTGSIVSVAQRLHPEDITGHLLEKETFHHLILSSRAQSQVTIPLYNRRSWHRSVGDILSPSRESAETLERIRTEIGAAAYAAQYLQEPQAETSEFLTIEDLHLVERMPDLKCFVRRVQSWDPAAKDGPDCDYSACVTAGWHREQERWYLLDVYRGRISYPDLKDRVVSHRLYWRAERVLIEDSAMGVSLVQDLRGDRHPWVKTWLPQTGKLERFLPVTSWLKDGRLVIPTDKNWYDPFRRELLAFPDAGNDDQVDALVQFMHWKEHRGMSFLDTDPPTGRRIGKYRPPRSPRRYPVEFRASGLAGAPTLPNPS